MRFLGLYLPLTTILVLLLIALTALTKALAYDAQYYADLRAFLQPPAGCPTPCFMGIRPGVTPVDEAVAILEAHEWVETVDVFVAENGNVMINWRWNSTTKFIPSDEPAWSQIIAVEGLVVSISFKGAFSMHDVWMIYGTPEKLFLPFGSRWNYVAVYPFISFSVSPECPYNAHDILRSPDGISVEFFDADHLEDYERHFGSILTSRLIVSALNPLC